MKRILAVLVVFSFVAAAQAVNILTNSSFENPSDTTNWNNTGWTGEHGERVNWWPREGALSGNFWSWDDNWRGWAYQDVPVATGGTFGAGIWVRLETNLPAANTALMTIAWYDAATNPVAPSNTAVFASVPRDGKWHHVHVKGTCTSSDLAFVRARFDASWGASPLEDQVTYYYDNAELFRDDGNVRIGSETPLWNGSFEAGSANWWETFRVSQWEYSYVGGEEGCRREPWGGRSGQWLLAFRGWEANQPSYSTEVSQRVVPRSLGTNTLAFWAKMEENFGLTNFQVWIEWYDATFTNKVKADDVLDLTATMTNDAQWREYWITGVCTNTDLNEARVVFLVQFDTNSLGGAKSMMIDDVRFMDHGYDGSSLETDWAYHAARGYYAVAEQVPGGGYGAFLQANFVTGTNTFYALSQHPTVAKYEDEFGSMGLRTSWQKPDSSWSNDLYDMTYLGTIELASGSPFHGLPAAGTVTVDVWRTRAPQPMDDVGQPFTTNTIPFYYAPYLQATIGVQNAGIEYLLFNDGDLTNNLGQIGGSDYGSRDYLYWNRVPAPNASLLNGGFEDTTGWVLCGRAGAEPWASHSGATGMVFQSWDAGDAAIYQDVDTTGGVLCLSAWIKIETSAVPIDLRMRMEWYDTNGIVVRVNERDLTSHSKDTWWSKVAVVGQCLDPNLDFVRVSLSGRFADGLGGNEATVIDDVEFVAVGTNLLNGGFELGTFNVTNWHGYLISQDTWAARNGTYGASLHGWEETRPNYEAYIAQPLAVATGTYTFTAWIAREVDVLLTNCELRLEWYDESWSTKVQADSVKMINVPNDNTFREYYISGTCASPDLAGVRPMIVAQLDRNIGAASRAMKVDDASFVQGGTVEDTDGDGIPDWWEISRFGDLTTSGIGSNSDGDVWTDLEEWWADTGPLDADSVFQNVITQQIGYGVMILQAGPPTTNTRRYDAWWNTNLVTGPWVPLNLNVTGRADGLPVDLVVTNDDPAGRYYQTGVKVPP